jgi:electron transfer flavoprotein beta subunit
VKIIICIKQVPNTTEVLIDPNTGLLNREGIDATINPFDLYAIEEGIRLKERHGAEVSVISMGPPQAETALRDALALGCDDAFLLTDKTFAGADTLATAYTLACAIRQMAPFDLIICGLKTTDGDTAQVGPGLAEELNIPHVSYVRKINALDNKLITVERSLDDWYEDVVAPLPCLLTVTKEINVPRLPSFRRKMLARKTPITTWTADDIHGEKDRFGLEGSPTRVIRVFPPSPRLGGEKLEGSPSDQAEMLVQKLREKGIV